MFKYEGQLFLNHKSARNILYLAFVHLPETIPFSHISLVNNIFVWNIITSGSEVISLRLLRRFTPRNDFIDLLVRK